jgi:hypothetical protein
VQQVDLAVLIQRHQLRPTVAVDEVDFQAGHLRDHPDDVDRVAIRLSRLRIVERRPVQFIRDVQCWLRGDQLPFLLGEYERRHGKVLLLLRLIQARSDNHARAVEQIDITVPGDFMRGQEFGHGCQRHIYRDNRTGILQAF